MKDNSSLYELHNSKAPYPLSSTVVELFDQQVQQNPQQLAIVFNGQEINYAQLDEVTNQLAHFLVQKLDLGIEDLVGVQLDRSEWLIIAQLAILKTGAAFVAIDPTYPDARINYIKADSQCKTTIDLEFLQAFIENQKEYSSELLPVKIQAHHLAYVIYTSGSTGKPKGVMVEHRNLINLCYWHQEKYHLDTNSRGTLYSGVGFDASIWEIYPYLLSGASLYPIHKKEVRFDLEKLCAFFNNNGITHAYVPTQLCQELVNGNFSLPHTTILTGGELLKLSQPTSLKIYNNYGPTEYTVVTTVYEVKPETSGIIPIGKPISNTEIYIISEQQELLAPGAIGELCISGESLSRGYLHQEELTREKFIANPFIPGTWMYKTGDLAKCLPDGNIEFAGRIDDQVKIRGYRIELGEIEHELSQMQGIKNSVVLLKTTAEDKYLIAYYVSEKSFATKALKDHLASRLPEYMVPTYFVQLQALPLTPNGKLDKTKLPEPQLENQADYQAPSTALEKQLQEIWAEVLKIDKKRIGINHSFFALGGHSLKALRLLNKIARELHLSISIDDIFTSQNIQQLAIVLEQSKTSQFLPIESAIKADFYPLSSAQHRMHFLHELDSSSLTYNVPNAWRVKGTLNRDSLVAAFQQLILRHESLRTCFVETTQGPVQKILPTVDFSLEEYAVGKLTIPQLIQTFVRPFDLTQAPLFRVGFIAIAPEDQILLLDFHHIVIDGISYEILIKEFADLYTGKPLVNLPRQYKDYAVWQQTETYKKGWGRQKAFWLSEYSEEVEVLKLPEDYSRPTIRTGKGITLNFDFSPAQSNALETMAQEEGITMYLLLLSIFTILLSKLSSQEDVIVGTPVSGREHDDLEGVVGVFINTLAIRNRPKGSLTFQAYLSEVKSKVLDCFNHQYFPYEALVSALDWKRDISRNPLFDVLFAYQKFEDTIPVIPGLIMDVFEYTEEAAQFDLTFTGRKTERGLGFSLNYATDLFTQATIERFATCFINLAVQVIADRDIKLNTLELLSEEEKQALLKEGNQTQVAYPTTNTILDFFDAQVAKTPHNIALRFDDSQLTYLQLQEQVEQVVAYLVKEEKLKPGALVGIRLEREPYLIPLIFGILKAGAAYIPIDVRNPEERINAIIEESGLELLLTREKYETVSLSEHCKVVCLEQIQPVIQTMEPLTEPVFVDPTNLAYIIFTSGSTGKPKGVMIEHLSLANLIQSMDKRYPLKESGSFLLKTTFAFDVSVAELFGWFMNGGSLTILAQGGEGDPTAIIQAIAKYRVTHINFVPSMFSVFIEALETLDLNEIKSLAYLFLAGEELPPDLVLQFNALNTGILLENIYGPTEATIYSSAYSTHQLSNITKIPIGKPLDNVTLYILNANHQLQPPGIFGELCIGGKGLARGYVNNEAFTNEKFVPHPFIAGERIYKTGDLARSLPDGNIEYHGRIDNQVKIRGYRIELGEIENQLTLHPQIISTAVLAIEQKGDKNLVAYYVAKEEVDIESLNKHLALSLPEYMIPSFYVRLDKMPLNSSGKLNRKALPEPTLSSAATIIAPANTTEEKLVEIWAEVLKIDPEMIGVTQSFFELGGHSLKATTLINRIYRALDVRVPLRTVFTHQNIRSLSSYLLAATKSSYIPIEKSAVSEYYPLSAAQKRMYFLYCFDPEALTYNMPRVEQLAELPDREKLARALQQLVARHEILRSTFHLHQGEPIQKIVEKPNFEILEYQSTDNDLDRLIFEFIRPFDLSTAPLLRVAIATVATTKHYLFIDMHHIVMDGVSHELMVNDIRALYRGEELLPLPLQYKDYVRWQQSEDQQQKMDQQKSFWLEKFREVPPSLDLPLDFSRPPVKSHSGQLIKFALNETTTTALRTLAEQEQVTLFMLLLTLYKILLSKLSNQEDIVVGIPVAGRQHVDLENMIGLFVNTLPIRNSLNGAKNFTALLKEIKQDVVSCFEHQSFQYEELVDALKVERNTSRNPLFDVLFAFNNFTEASADSIFASSKSYETWHGISKFDLSLTVTETENQLLLSFEYATDLFKKETIDRCVVYFHNLISSILKSPEQKIFDISLLSEEEKFQLLNKFNKTPNFYPSLKTILDIFDKQALETPEKSALYFGDTMITYREVQEQSNKMARYLIDVERLEVGDFVGIILEREALLVPIIFGILKAGGAYIPIDVKNPRERTETIIEESKLKLLITRNIGEEDSLTKHCRILDLNKGLPEIERMKPGPIPVAVKPTDLAYVIFTSGSTGKPKGVMIEHRSLSNLIQCMDEQYPVEPTGNFLLKTNYAFDVSVAELFGWFINGGSLTILPPGAESEPQIIVETIARYQVSHLNFVPSMFAVFVQALGTENIEKIKSLSYIFLAGEELPLDLVRKFQGFNTEIKLENIYGPTETTIYCTSYSTQKLEGTIRVPIGKPLTNLSAYILDRHNRLQPLGVAGELCIGGVGVARGYLNKPTLTDEKFIANPYRDKERIYKTGDLARWLVDGNIEYLGRIDNQVKIRGYRIELGEIENQLLAHDQVTSCAVIIKTRAEDKYLVAYYVAAQVLESEELNLYLSKSLPEYMLPSHFIWLDKMPINASGKLDRKALPEPEIKITATYVPPNTETEKILVSVWAEVLKIDQKLISVNSSFFDLGGHSLKAIAVIGSVFEKLNINLRVADFFRLKSVAKIADHLENELWLKLNAQNDTVSEEEELLID